MISPHPAVRRLCEMQSSHKTPLTSLDLQFHYHETCDPLLYKVCNFLPSQKITRLNIGVNQVEKL
jgi:hypothetical protein